MLSSGVAEGGDEENQVMDTKVAASDPQEDIKGDRSSFMMATVALVESRDVRAASLPAAFQVENNTVS